MASFRAALSWVAAIAILASQVAWAQRVLLQDSVARVTLDQGFRCGEAAKISVESSQPGLFQRDSPELQRIVDAARAVLLFECSDIPEIRLQGRLAGLAEPVYGGVASPASQWLVQTAQAIQSRTVQEAEADQTTPMQPSASQPVEPSEEGLTVANLALGMSVKEASAAISGTFGVEPEYDVARGTLTAQMQGCPGDFDWVKLSPAPRAGWKCLTAWFTDQREARLYRLELIQVVKGEPQGVEQALIERFGAPAERRTDSLGASWWQSGRQVTGMAWGDAVARPEAGVALTATLPVHELQAAIESVSGVTVTKLTLYNPSLRPGWPQDKPSKETDLRL